MKKTQASIVVSVLLILISIAALFVLWNFIDKVISQSSKEGKAKASCLDVNLRIIKVDPNKNEITIRREQGDEKQKIDGFIILVNGEREATINKNLAPLQSETVQLSTDLHGTDMLQTATIIGKNICPPSPEVPAGNVGYLSPW